MTIVWKPVFEVWVQILASSISYNDTFWLENNRMSFAFLDLQRLCLVAVFNIELSFLNLRADEAIL